MPNDEDHRLLAEYRASGSQAAFAQLVARHVDLVYSVARRRVGDAHLAEDVAQAVFLTLARKARAIGSDVVISGWLFNTARLIANNALKSRVRQQKREAAAGAVAEPRTTATTMMTTTSPSPDWDAIAPHLELAMDHLGRGERDAVLLRFYRGMSFKEVAGAIGISEDAASQRVSRGVAKLRAYFAARGVNTTGDALMLGVAAHAVAAAPAALHATIAASATSVAAGAAAAAAATGAGPSATATTLSNGAMHAMTLANLKIAAVVTAAVVLTGTAGVVSYNAIGGTPRASPAPQATAAAPAPPAATAPPTAPAVPDIDADMAALLAKKLPELRTDAIAATDIFDFLRDVTGANIHIDWRRLQPLGADPRTPITMNATDLSFADTLRQVIGQMTAAKPPANARGDAPAARERVKFIATEGVIIITAADDVPRLRAAQQWHANMPTDPATRKILDRALPELNFRQIQISDTIDFLRDVAGANIFVNWRALEAGGVDRNRPITLRLRNVPLRTCLWLLLESAQAKDDAPLDYVVEKNVISISTSADLAKGGKGKLPAATAPAPAKPR